jgi:4-hydroxy-tetrahydrodipicolinate synthase
MKELLQLRGIITVLNTPFTGDDHLDLPGLRRNVAAALDAGVAGFLVPAMASEVGKLHEREREALVDTVVQTVAGRAVVIGGASAASPAESKRHAARCIALGCQGVLASIPYTTDAQYTAAVHELAALNPPFLMLQDWDAAGAGVPVPLIAALFDTVPAFRCLKVEVVPAGAKYSAVRQATGGRLHVSGGWAVMQMIEALDRGVDAFMPTGLHPLYTGIFNRYHAGQRDAARALFNRLLPVLAFSNQHLDISIHFFKRLLHRQGLYATPRVRQPILPFDAHHARIADELIDYALQLMANPDAPMG